MFASIAMLVLFISHLSVADALIGNKQNVLEFIGEGHDEIKGNTHIDPETLLNMTRRLATLFRETTGTKVSKADDAGANNPEQPMLELTVEFAGLVSLSCPPGYTLLSCGISNTQTRRHEAHRSSVPVSSSTCSCYDYYGARCHAWCSTLVQYQHVTYSGLQRGLFRVDCPSGFKVAGCHLSSPDNVKEEAWRSHYPTADGNGCMCYDYYGAHCVASCVSNIESHEVRSVYSRELVKVGCSSPDLYVLGCGMESSSNNHQDLFREFRVYLEHECACRDQYGTTCYVTCGKFK